MSLKERIQPGNVLRTLVETVAIGAAESVVGSMGVVMRHHRQLTHRSLDIHPILEAIIDWEMRVYSPDPTVWAAVHRIHHHIPDASLDPFRRIANAIKWVEVNPNGVAAPERYPYLDPFVETFSKKDVLEIGQYADEIMIDRLGGTYRPPENYNKEDLCIILNPQKPMYVYEKGPEPRGKYTQDDIAKILLTDPHSPALFPPGENGVREVLLGNVALYRRASHLFQDRPDLKPKDLQTGKKVDHRKTRYRGFIEGSLLNFAMVLVAKNKYEPGDIVKALIEGTAITGVKTLAHILGGNFTNSWGHAGVMTPERFLQTIGDLEYRLVLNPDGTVSTDGDGGLLAEVVHRATYDEMKDQGPHHEFPDQIAYTTKVGPAARKEAPFGSLLKSIAESRFPLINPGPGFDVKERKDRPDMPNPAMEIIHCRRVEQLRSLRGR